MIIIMPSATPAHRAIRDELRQSVRDALGLNVLLECIVHLKQKQQGTFHGKVDHSQPPWQASVANAVLDLHALAREMEAWLRLSQGLPKRERGGSSDNTRKALENVVRLSEAAEDGTVKSHHRQLDRWNGGAKVALGKTERPSRLPRAKGEPPRLCPWCERDTLKMLPQRGLIMCTGGDCRDENQQRPRGAMIFSDVAMDWIVVWQDNSVGLP